MFAELVILLYVSRLVVAEVVEVYEEVESVLLPCRYFGLIPEKNPTVIWSRYDLNPTIVHLRREDEDDLQGQNQHYSMQTSMKPDALYTGDFSLTLRKPQLTDSGYYTCSISDGRREERLRDIQLQVKERFPAWAKTLLVLLIVVLVLSGSLLYKFRHYFMSVYWVEVDLGVESVQLPCKTIVHLPRDVTVKWMNSETRIVHAYETGYDWPEEQHWLYKDQTEMKKKKLKTGDLTLTLKTPTDSDTYTCTAYSREGNILIQKQVQLRVRGGYSLKIKAGPVSAINDFIAIIAIDFGTAYSGYAFSLTPREAEIDPFLKRWGKEFGLDTPKTPTCILFNEDKEFIKFGYEAKTVYIRMHREEAKKHYFFENFKMAIYGKKLSRDVVITAANRKSMKALKIFTEALRYLKDDALRTINASTVGRKFTASDFTWVLTVPAIWDPSAKQFMREAATQAGIVTEGTQHQLIMALEPEAASVWCKKLPADAFITQNHDGGSLDQSPGTQLMVVDCGGGTIDITVHEVLDGGALKELHKSSGNDLGGQAVDRKFKEFLREIFNHGVWDEYEENFPSEVQRIMHDFLYFKQVDDDVQITCPFNLGTLAQKKQEIEKFFESVRGVFWDEGSIIISKERLRSFFAESLKGITDRLREILKRDLNIKYILLVGGYAESQILRHNVIDQFGDQCKVLCPFRPQEAIIKGAVIFGRNPGLVASRKSAFTYGFAVAESFQHRAAKKFRVYGEKNFCDIFRKLVEEGEDVGCNETREVILNPSEANLTSMKISLYRTDRKNPKYVDEVGVEEICSLHVDMPDTSGGINQKVKLELLFGSTEVTFTATDLVSGSSSSVALDFMTK